MNDLFQIEMELSPPRCRRSDPSTSHAAAKKARRFASGQAVTILNALKQHGPLAPCQMFTFTGLTTTQADRRRKEMVLAGLIRVLDRDVDGCAVWEAI